MQLSSRILTALAVLILAVAVVAVRAGSPGTVEAATGTINVINVGTCYTTDTDVFSAGDCNDGDTTEGYKVADRETAKKVDTVFATYAIDPKTSGEEPRAILINSDVIKINIKDKGRDKRTGKLYAVTANTVNAPQIDDPAVNGAIRKALGDLADDLDTADHDDDETSDEIIQLESLTARFIRSDQGDAGLIGDSGDAQFRLSGEDSTKFPMAPDGKVYWFGTVTQNDTAAPVQDLTTQDLTTEFITLDEDFNPGTEGSVAPWMRVSAAVPADVELNVQYIYYQTSEKEELRGGKKKSEYGPVGDRDVSPVFTDDETEDDDALVLRASGDGNAPSQNLWLKEVDRFSGKYEGYLRLTDADGDGSKPASDDEKALGRGNWGLRARDASDEGEEEYAVLGTESGPVTITYKNSNGDNTTISITIDKEAPTIQVEAPINKTASKDDSPELLGSFTDGGGSGLREESFKIYADNTPDGKDDSTPVWDLRVNNNNKVDDPESTSAPRGYICVDADEDADGCESNGVAVLRGHYAGYSEDQPTYGIVSNNDIYFDEDTQVGGEDKYKTADAETFADGDTSGIFDTVVRIDFDPDLADNRRYNHIIDIQAVVMDVAGNIGFSDSEPGAPTFIHDLGTTTTDNKRDDDDLHNVLGWFSRHVYYLDDVDPKYLRDESATGFFPDADGDVMVTDSGLMIVFDGPIDAATVGSGTFSVELDGGADATIVDAVVDGKIVYLQLEEQLPPNATPSVDLASGQSISDLAGNESTDRRLDGIELNDGILPTFEIALSGGSGLNDDVDGEGPSELTDESGIKLTITSNEVIQSSPKFAVVCSDLTWGAKEENDVAKFASNRTGTFSTDQYSKAEPTAAHSLIEDADGEDTSAASTMCPKHTDAATLEDAGPTFFDVAQTNAQSRTGNRWEYEWSDLSGDQSVEDGTLSVIVWGRDRSSYFRGKDRVYNYSAATSGFEYDTDLKSAWDDGDPEAQQVERELIPAAGEDVFELRPFVLLDFGDEGTTVDVTTFQVDGVEHSADLQRLEDEEFVWWPERLDYGTYEVYVEANDAANNTDEHTYSFTVKERAPFVLDLLAGWNSISFPANPVDRALHAVFTNPAVDQVIGWNVTEPVSPWRMATRVDGVWTTNEEYATLNDVEARYGYWVHSTGFITQAVKLSGKGDRATDGQPNPSDIPTDEGWNFIGVVDVDGDQTQDDAGETLRNSNNDPITAAEYLGAYTRAYAWDHINNTWDVVKRIDSITIGTGVWVYYTSDHDIAP